jgi:hypothetical protein
MLSTIFSNNESLLNLLNNLHLNPIKILLFNNIWTILQNYS